MDDGSGDDNNGLLNDDDSQFESKVNRLESIANDDFSVFLPNFENMDGELHPSGSTLENQVDDVCQRTAQGAFGVLTTTSASSDFGVGLDAVDSLLQGLV